MSDNRKTFISQDWDELAVDNDIFVAEKNSYFARIFDRDDNEYTTQIGNISFRPEINTAPSLTIDVEPKKEFRDSIFLGGVLEVFVNGEILFAGRIVSFEYSSRDGDWYTVKVESPGRRLIDETVDDLVQGEILIDYLSKLVDKSNDFDDEHFEMTNTDDENLTDIIEISTTGRRADVDGAIAEYQSVGPSAKEIDQFYFKAKHSGTLTISTDNSDFTKDFSGLDSEYGEWVKVVPSIQDDEEYDVEFILDENSILYDWISLTDDEFQRISEPFEPEILFEGKTVDIIETQDDWDEVIDIENEDNSPVKKEDGTLSLHQTSFTTDTKDQVFEDPTDGLLRNEDEPDFDWQSASDGQYFSLIDNTLDHQIEINFENEYTIPSDNFGVSIRTGHETANQENTQTYDITFDDFDTIFSGDKVVSEDRFPFDIQNIDSVEDGNGNDVTADFSISQIEEDDIDGLEINNLNSFLQDFLNDNNLSIDFLVGKDAFENVGTESYSEITINYTVRLDTVDNFHEGFTDMNIEVYLDDKNIGITGAFESGWDWNNTIHNEEIQPGNHTIRLELPDDQRAFRTDFRSVPGVKIDVVCPHDNRYDYFFDNEVNEPEGYLNGPEKYPRGFSVIPIPSISTGNVVSATLNIDTNNVSDVQFIQTRFSEDDDWLPIDGSQFNTDQITIEPSVPTRFLQARLGLAGIGERNNATPMKGFNSQEIYSYEFIVDADDLDIIFDQEYQDTRLSVLSSVADDSVSVFRWEGNQCRLFKRGSRFADVEIKSEEITSSIDIENSYKSVEVIGRDDITSGIVELEDAPDYLTKHREIVDRSIDNVNDANRKAQVFLANNGEIKYSGGITTLPTLVPVGDKLPGDMFTHGEDGIIQSANYSMTRTNISVGEEESIGLEILNLKRSERDSQRFDIS